MVSLPSSTSPTIPIRTPRRGTFNIPREIFDLMGETCVPHTIILLWEGVTSYQYTEHDPYPSNGSIAKHMSRSLSTIERLVLVATRCGWLEKMPIFTRGEWRIAWSWRGLMTMLDRYKKETQSLTDEQIKELLPQLAALYPIFAKKYYLQQKQLGAPIPARRTEYAPHLWYIMNAANQPGEPTEASEQPSDLRSDPGDKITKEITNIVSIHSSLLTQNEHKEEGISYSLTPGDSNGGQRDYTNTNINIENVTNVTSKQEEKSETQTPGAEQSARCEPRKKLEKPKSWNRDTLFFYLQSLDAIRRQRKLELLPSDILCELPDYLLKLRDQEPASTYTRLLGIWRKFAEKGVEPTAFAQEYLGEIFKYVYGAPKRSRTQKGQPQGIRLFMTIVEKNAELCLNGQEWRPAMIVQERKRKMQDGEVRMDITQSCEAPGVQVACHNNGNETLIVVEGNEVMLTQEVQEAQPLEIHQQNDTSAGDETRQIIQANKNVVEARMVEQTNIVKPSAELVRRQKTGEAIKTLRNFVYDSLWSRGDCADCGCPIATTGGRCVVCYPLSEWDTQKRKRIKLIADTIPTIEEARELSGRP